MYTQQHMGSCAELLVQDRKYSREDQDNFAIKSYSKACEAIRNNIFEDEIVPIDGLSYLKSDYPNINYKVVKNGLHDLTYALPSIVGKFLSEQLQSFSNSG